VGRYTGSPYDPFAELESNNNNAPSGTVLTTFTIAQPGISSSQQTDVTFTPDTTVTLAPNTNYWFILGTNSNGSEFYWNYTEGSATSTGPGSILYSAASADQGASWGLYAPAFLIEADGVAVPEPSTLIPSGMAVLLGPRLRLASSQGEGERLTPQQPHRLNRSPDVPLSGAVRRGRFVASRLLCC